MGYILSMNAWLMTAGGIWIFFSGLFILSVALAARDEVRRKKGFSAIVLQRGESSEIGSFQLTPVMLRRRGE